MVIAMSRIFRAFIAASAGLVFSLAFLIIVSLLGGIELYGVMDFMLPAVSGVTPNVNTSIIGQTQLSMYVLIIFSITSGIIIFCLIWDSTISSMTEQVIAVIGLVGIGSASGVNFWARDALIRIEAQAIVDFLLAIFGVAVMTVLWRWHTQRILLHSFRLVALLVTTVFGVLMPLYFAINLLFIRFGFVDRRGDVDMNALSAIQYVTSGLTLVAFAIGAALLAFRYRLQQRAEIIKSAPAGDRIEAIAATAEFFRVDVSGLSPEKQQEVVLAQLNYARVESF